MDKRFEHFTVTILKLNKLVQKIKLYEMSKYGLKAIHVMCGYYLRKNPEGLTSSELVKLTLEDKAAISRALKVLQEKGFVECAGSRNGLVRLTGEGKRLADSIYDKSDKAVSAGSATLSDSERTLFYNSLGSIAENLEKYYAKLIADKDNGDK